MRYSASRHRSKRATAGTSIFHRLRCSLLLGVGVCILAAGANRVSAETFGGIEALIGPRDSIWVADPHGRVILSKNAGRSRIPASILKLLTALTAVHHLGLAHRFVTEVYLDPDHNLILKGYGDPLLVSEVLQELASGLARRLKQHQWPVGALLLDDSYFGAPLTIPGVTDSRQPYDAPNGALCANFNTIRYRKTSDGNYASAERQTPLIPFARKKLTGLQASEGRVVLSHDRHAITRYAGHLLAYFLKERGVAISGDIQLTKVKPEEDILAFRYVSPYSLEDIIVKLMAHSNNFIANQLLIASGAKVHSSPGTLPKGVRTAEAFAHEQLGIDSLALVEGSGISRRNRISANGFARILKAFLPLHGLLRHTGRDYYKTGTLNGVRTRAGYIESRNGGFYMYVVMLNTPGKSTATVMRRLLNGLD